MGKYKFTTDKVRLSGQEGENIFVEGYAITKGLDSYNTKFSNKCMESIGDQLVKKDIKVGSQHFNALTKIAKQKLQRLQETGGDKQLIKDLEVILQGRDYADAMPVEAKFDGNGVYLKTKLNKHLAKIDNDYFSALTGQLQDGFLNGMSIEFDTNGARSHKEYDKNSGKYVTVFDHVPVNGISFVSNASNPGARITEVAVRMATDLDELKGEKMTEEKKEEAPKVVEQQDVNPEVVKALEEKIKKQVMEDIAAKQAEEQKKADEEAVKQENEDLKKQLAEAKEAQANGQVPAGKGLVNPNQQPGYAPSEETKSVEQIKKDIENMTMAEALAEYERQGLGFASRKQI